MVVLETLAVAFSMFSALPMPGVDWNERNLRYTLCAFPVVGAVIGGVCWLWFLLCGWLSLPMLLKGAGLCVLPVLITGGIHLDGYADTCDALASHAAPEKKREILKDPRLGAFAAIRLCVYFVLTLAFWTSLPEFRVWPILGSFCLSRTLSALALTVFPLAEGSGLAKSFAEASDQIKVRNLSIIMALIWCALMIFTGGWTMVVAVLLVFAYYYHVSQRQFGGLSGDLAGWFLQTAELWMLLALCLQQYLEKVL